VDTSGGTDEWGDVRTLQNIEFGPSNETKRKVNEYLARESNEIDRFIHRYLFHVYDEFNQFMFLVHCIPHPCIITIGTKQMHYNK